MKPRGGAVLNAAKTHCPAGHPYSGHNLILVKRHGKVKGRQCRICKIEQVRALSKRQRFELSLIRALRDDY